MQGDVITETLSKFALWLEPLQIMTGRVRGKGWVMKKGEVIRTLSVDMDAGFVSVFIVMMKPTLKLQWLPCRPIMWN